MLIQDKNPTKQNAFTGIPSRKMRQEFKDVHDQLLHTIIKSTHSQAHRLFQRTPLETRILRGGNAESYKSIILQLFSHYCVTNYNIHNDFNTAMQACKMYFYNALCMDWDVNLSIYKLRMQL